MIVLYTPIPNEKIRKDAEETITKIHSWFEVNPKRDTCNAKLWYGQMIIVRRGHIEEDINKARDVALKDEKKERLG